MSTFSQTFKCNEHWAEYINKSQYYKYNWCEGAYRSSKSVSNTLAFALYLENTEDKIHLVIASTVSSARNIVEDGDGCLGLKYYFASRYKETKYKGNDAGIIKTKTGEKIIVYLGGAMESSFKIFRGWSIGGVILEELNLLHENTINEAKGRILLAKDPKVFISHNPVSSAHPIYEWLEELEEKGLVNYNHSTIDDNPALTEERRTEIKAEYDPDSIFYKQYILGQRVSAEGLVYSLKDYNYTEYDSKEYIKYIFTADIGDGPSATVFHCLGLRRGFKGVDVLFEYRHRNDDKQNKNNPKQPIQYAEDLRDFILSAMNNINKYPDVLIIDGSPAFYRDIQSVIKNTEIKNITIRFPFKEDIAERIRYSNSLLYQGRLRFNKNCKETINSFKFVQYDPKAYTKGDIKYYDEPTMGTRVDEVDSVLYGVYYFINDLKRINYNIHTEAE